MKLSNDQVKEILKNPTKTVEIQKGRRYESRLRLFTETRFEEDLKHEYAWNEYKTKLQSKLSKAKYDKILSFIDFPLPVVDISNSCLNELNKVFDARNMYFHEEYSTPQLKKAIAPIIQEVNPHKWIIENGKEVIKNKPNSIVVIDKDEEANPYLLLIDSNRLIDFELNCENKSELEYIVFVHSVQDDGLRVSVYDDESYRVYFKPKDSDEFNAEPEINSMHTAGECPARMFMNQPLNSSSPYNRRIPFSNVISKMEQWQNFDTYKFYTDHYGPFPVIEAPKENCSVENCKDGQIKEEHRYLEDGEARTMYKYHPCPACKSRDLIGPGTVIRIKPKIDKDDVTEAGVFKMISNPVENLEYIDKKINDLESYIVGKSVGINTVIQGQAINEDQVRSSYDSRQNILISLKENFDLLYVWIVETIANLEVKGSEISVSADFGTEFYLLSEEELQSLFDTAKKSGLPASELDSLFKQIIDTKYKGNNIKIERALIMKYLEPLPYNTMSEVIGFNADGLIDQKELILKLNFISFVDRFEMEQAPLTEFGSGLNPWKRVQKIKQIFNTYIDEQINNTKQVGSGAKPNS